MQLKALVLISALLALLVFASVGFAQDNEKDDPSQTCVIIINIIDNDQYANQSGAPFFQYNSEFIQYISQRFNISPTVVQECIQEFHEDRGDDDNDRNRDNDNDNNQTNNNPTTTTTTGAGGIVGADEIAGLGGEDVLLRRGDEILADTIPSGLLPATGGPSLLLVGGALLLLLAGRVAARLFRP